MFIDEITLNISAGKGGNGIVSWRHEKGRDHAGPGGGNGGNGGDVYLKGVRDVSKLYAYRFVKDFKAEDGQDGRSEGMYGANGEDMILELPIGSVVKDIETGEEVEVLSEEPLFFLKGGRGGLGNEHFKSSKNIRPQESTEGKEAESGVFFIELKLVAHLGLVGLPNAGKSSLLNSITNSKSKIGSYAFTTLSPNLGDFYGFVLADIPGLIEGAGEGKGLGHKFLRHISRTKMILHCISCENEDVFSVYKTIRDELGNYDKELLNKQEIILFTKTDLISKDVLDAHKKIFDKTHNKILSVSVLDDSSLKEFKDELVKILRNM
ncbi:MAG: GTPase ObgE [Candidatus Paceibacterota bacterium]